MNEIILSSMLKPNLSVSNLDFNLLNSSIILDIVVKEKLKEISKNLIVKLLESSLLFKKSEGNQNFCIQFII